MFAVDERRVTTNLSQPHQPLQYHKGVFPQRIITLEPEQHALNAGEFGLVQFFLLRLEFAQHVLFGTRRQIKRHLTLGPAQEKRPQPGP